MGNRTKNKYGQIEPISNRQRFCNELWELLVRWQNQPMDDRPNGIDIAGVLYIASIQVCNYGHASATQQLGGVGVDTSVVWPSTQRRFAADVWGLVAEWRGRSEADGVSNVEIAGALQSEMMRMLEYSASAYLKRLDKK